jgi:hypothetical protein
MKASVTEAFKEMLENWSAMQRSDMDSAGDDADRFQDSFYRFIDELKEWIEQLTDQPRDLGAALAMPEIDAFVEQLPGPLYLNFETELELILEGITRTEDERYD